MCYVRMAAADLEEVDINDVPDSGVDLPDNGTEDLYEGYAHD